MDQGRGAAKSDPNDIPKLDSVLRSLSSQGIQPKLKLLLCKKPLQNDPKYVLPSLLDSASKVSLIHQSYFKEHLLPRIETPMGEKADAHVLFNLTATNDGQLLVKTYTGLDVNVLGLKVPNVGFLI